MVNRGDAMVIDVRETWEYQGGHAPGSVNIPLGEIPGALSRLRNENKTLIFVCASGNRSGQAASWVQAQGVPAVLNGGPWQNAA